MSDDLYFMRWLADRLVNVYGESPNVDFVLKLREMAKPDRFQAGKECERCPNAECVCLYGDCSPLCDVCKPQPSPEVCGFHRANPQIYNGGCDVCKPSQPERCGCLNPYHREMEPHKPDTAVEAKIAELSQYWPKCNDPGRVKAVELALRELVKLAREGK